MPRLKNRVAIYQREATEMLQNIAQYPGLTEEQLCRFFPEKESTAKILLSHMLKEGRAWILSNILQHFGSFSLIDRYTIFQ